MIINFHILLNINVVYSECTLFKMTYKIAALLMPSYIRLKKNIVKILIISGGSRKIFWRKKNWGIIMLKINIYKFYVINGWHAPKTS